VAPIHHSEPRSFGHFTISLMVICPSDGMEIGLSIYLQAMA
jgi:hypothetical protein